MNMRHYTKNHEWISWDGETATVGITDHAREALGGIVHVDLPQEGRQIARDEDVGVIESVKTASELYAPVSGMVTVLNGAVLENPEHLDDLEQELWLFKMTVSDEQELAGLMDEQAYQAFVAAS